MFVSVNSVCEDPGLKLNPLLSGLIFVLHTRSDLGADGGGNGGVSDDSCFYDWPA